METRKDSWDVEADLLLAQTVLQHIETGSTQLKAFEEASEKLNRSKAACGFRWNSSLRKQYEKDVKEAKRTRSQNKNDGNIVSINNTHTDPAGTSKRKVSKGKEKVSIEENIVRSIEAPTQLNHDFIITFNEVMDQLGNNITVLRQMTIELAERLEEANDQNKKLKSDYVSLQNEIINAVDMKVLIRLADNVSSKNAEQITG
jgi:prespore-specific regulator